MSDYLVKILIGLLILGFFAGGVSYAAMNGSDTGSNSNATPANPVLNNIVNVNNYVNVIESAIKPGSPNVTVVSSSDNETNLTTTPTENTTVGQTEHIETNYASKTAKVSYTPSNKLDADTQETGIKITEIYPLQNGKEYMKIKNNYAFPVNIQGYKIIKTNCNFNYTFGSAEIPAGETLTVYTKTGKNTLGEYYMGLKNHKFNKLDNVKLLCLCGNDVSSFTIN